MIYDEYDPQVLKKLQRAQTDILADFSALCEANGIDYFVIGGTLLGLVRHKGFIPWDDDTDVGMTRENYEKFLAIADNAFDGKYRAINYENNPKFALMFTKWYRTGTVMHDQTAMTMGYKAGIAIDVLSFENAPNNEKKRRRQNWIAWFWGKLFILRSVSRPVIYAYGFKAKIASAIAFVGHGFLRLFHISSKFLYNKAMKAAKKYNGEKTDYVSFSFDPIPHLSVIKREDLEPTQWADFEDIKLKVPHRPEKYLDLGYGSHYMELPPEDKRYNHPPVELDFGAEE